MARGNIKGTLGPIMLALLLGVAGFMIYVVNTPDLAERFTRPEAFYDNTFEKVGTALLFALLVSAVVAIMRRNSK